MIRAYHPTRPRLRLSDLIAAYRANLSHAAPLAVGPVLWIYALILEISRG